MHLDAELIQRTLHDELDPARKAALSTHLAECAACRQALEEAEREEAWVLERLLQADDPPPLMVTARGVIGRARREAVAWRRKAAGVALALAASGAVAYAVPGSPVRAWVDRVIGRVSGVSGPGPIEPETAPSPQPAGIAVSPGGRFTIRFAARQSAGIAAVSLVDGPNVVARVLKGAATFSTQASSLVIGNRGSTADYEIEIPNSAPWVQVLVGDRRLLLKEGDHIVSEASTDAPGRYLLPLGSP